MSKTLPPVFIALSALLFAGAAMAAPADEPVPDAEAVPAAEPAAVQAEEAEPVPAVPTLGIEVPMTPMQGQGPPDFEECGDIFCPPNFSCCNPLENLCVREGEACIL